MNNLTWEFQLQNLDNSKRLNNSTKDYETYVVVQGSQKDFLQINLKLEKNTSLPLN